MGRHGFIVASLLLGVQALAGLGVSSAGATDPQSAEKPNVVVILTDDQRFDSMPFMHKTVDRIGKEGVTFTNGVVVNPECCPSRASLLTGQYSHTTGVYRNVPPNGGFESFDDDDTIATRLNREGYHTSMIGKYLNGYDSRYVPPGWDHWVSFRTSHSGIGHYFDYDLNVDGHMRHLGHHRSDYSTDLLARMAQRYIRNTNGPLFLMFAPAAPHLPAVPAPRDRNALSHLKKWRPPSYNERDIEDKLAFAHVPRMSRARQKEVDRVRRKQLRTLLSVDDAVAGIMDALRVTDRLNDTLVVFTSDNGFLWGEHRMGGKSVPWEESIKVPFLLRYDPLVSAPGSLDPRVVANIDVAATIADLLGLVPRRVDGESLLPLLADPSSPWRDGVLIEHVRDRFAKIPTYCAIRTDRYLYAVYKRDGAELYDLVQDAYELRNRAADPHVQAVVTGLLQRLRDLCRPRPPRWPGP